MYFRHVQRQREWRDVWLVGGRDEKVNEKRKWVIMHMYQFPTRNVNIIYYKCANKNKDHCTLKRRWFILKKKKYRWKFSKLLPQCSYMWSHWWFSAAHPRCTGFCTCQQIADTYACTCSCHLRMKSFLIPRSYEKFLQNLSIRKTLQGKFKIYISVCTRKFSVVQNALNINK